MAVLLLVAILGELIAFSGAVDVKYKSHEQEGSHEREDQEMEIQADGSAKGMMRREKNLGSEAGDPVATTTIFEEGVGDTDTESTSGAGSGDEAEEGEEEGELLRTDSKLQQKKTDPEDEEEGDADSSEDEDGETTTTAGDDLADDGSGLPEGESAEGEALVKRNSKSGSSAETTAASEEKKDQEKKPESRGSRSKAEEGDDDDEDSDSTDNDPVESDAPISSVEMEGFPAGAGPRHKASAKAAKAKASKGQPLAGHDLPQGKADSRHPASAAKTPATRAQPSSGKKSTDKKPAVNAAAKEKSVARPDKVEAKSHKAHKVQRKADAASLLSPAQNLEEETTLTTTFYFTLVASNKYCANANSGYKKNVGNYQTKACFDYVLNEASCGKYFDFGVVDGACDCIPKAETDCSQADAENYHVYLIQKGGPEALIEIDDQGRPSKEVIGDPADQGDSTDD